MNGFQHLPEYQSAARAYRLERTVVERAPRRPGRAAHPLRDRLAALLDRPAHRVPAAR
ncbi:hypothetical protein [uncultured Amnibacterium sp.]|uniref:hypothetical protein n=1 Tax=uncultured Amnibacterium sp. TaxID=1631851 RepID=UPI0035CB61C8